MDNEIPSDNTCPCQGCDEAERIINNPYVTFFQSTRCERCIEYRVWVNKILKKFKEE